MSIGARILYNVRLSKPMSSDIQPPRDDAQKPEALQLFHQAHGYQMKGDLEQAVGLYQKSIALYPTPEAHTFLGWALGFQGRFDAAIAEC